MNVVRISLCPECGACPVVELAAEEVRIGEEGNMVRLTKEQWNTLVEAVRSGTLGRM